MTDRVWFVTDGQSRRGPLAPEELRAELARSPAPDQLFVWRAGMKEWTAPDLVPELAGRALAPSAPGPRAPELSFGLTQPQWFLVGGAKLVVMSVITLGLYQLYWFYKQWDRVRDAGDNVQPAARSLFALVFCHSLFGRIVDSTYAVGVKAPTPAGGLTAAFILTSLAWRAPGAIGLLGFLSVVPLVVAQRVATEVALRQGSTEERNTHLTPLNWAGVAAAGGFALLGVLGVIYSTWLRAPTSQAYLSTVASEMNRTLPTMLDKDTQLVDTVGLEGALLYHYRLVNYTADQLDPSELDKGLRPSLVQKDCTTPQTRDTLLKQGVKLRHIYRDKNDRDVVTIEIVGKDCGLP